ncbi:MAG: metallophosphoesterase [Spirochaetes bacterium]|nr:metallophosphoesterase [Spirochaetota bacterium]
MKLGKFLLVCLLASAFAACSGADYTYRYKSDPDIKKLLTRKCTYPAARFIVFTDTHLFDRGLGLDSDGYIKNLHPSEMFNRDGQKVLPVALEEMKSIPADFVIICGDLTRQGERINHELMAKKLTVLTGRGKKVFVIPGNHDILIGHSFRYDSGTQVHTPNVTPEDFATIYAGCGYGEALSRDPSSLSYTAEPVKGLLLLALDSCRYRENVMDGHREDGGRFSGRTLAWIENRLIDAKKQNKAVIAFMHHGILEHFKNQSRSYPDFVLEDFERVSEMLAAYGVDIVFTGHYHAQSIVQRDFPDLGTTLFDIETGSFMNYPLPYRVCEISEDQILTVNSRFVSSIQKDGMDYISYAKMRNIESTTVMASDALKKFHVPDADIALVAPKIARAYVRHLGGDPVPADPSPNTEGLGLFGKLIMVLKGGLVTAWNTNLPPGLNHDIRINLDDGTVLR